MFEQAVNANKTISTVFISLFIMFINKVQRFPQRVPLNPFNKSKYPKYIDLVCFIFLFSFCFKMLYKLTTAIHVLMRHPMSQNQLKKGKHLIERD